MKWISCLSCSVQTIPCHNHRRSQESFLGSHSTDIHTNYIGSIHLLSFQMLSFPIQRHALNIRTSHKQESKQEKKKGVYQVRTHTHKPCANKRYPSPDVDPIPEPKSSSLISSHAILWLESVSNDVFQSQFPSITGHFFFRGPSSHSA